MTRYFFNAFVLFFITLVFTVKAVSIKHIKSYFVSQACCEQSIESSALNQNTAHHHHSDEEMDAHASAEAAAQDEHGDSESEQQQVEEFISINKQLDFDIYQVIDRSDYFGFHSVLLLSNYRQQIDRPPMS